MISERWITAARVVGYSRLALAVYAAMAVLWVVLSRDFIDPAGKPLGADFINFYAASDFALHGRLADAYDIARMADSQQAIVPSAAGQVVPWQYPPTFALLILPLALLPYSVAFVLFMSATLALYLWLIYAILPDRRAVLVAVAFTAVLVNALGGQNGFLSAALLGGGLILLETRPVAAGVLLGLLTYKPHLGLLVPLVLAAGGYWRVIGVAALATMVFALLAWLAFGTESWQAFWAQLPLAGDYLRTGVLPWDKMASVFAAARLLGAGVVLASGLHAIVALGAAALCVAAWRRRGDLEARAALAVSGTALAAPALYDYDLVLLAVPIAILAADGLRSGWMPGLRTLLVITWLSPAVGSSLARHAHLPLMPLVLLALFWACWRRPQLTSTAPLSRTQT
ncbi:MAG TPA: glycosyltransferase family 87 protein [Stellaceae bacterium]|nr:glycosyltransferase family 87 protein [Stellaceae bacterium]